MKFSIRDLVPKRRSYQFSLLSLFFAMVVVAIPAAEEQDVLGEPLTDQEVKEAVRGYLGKSQDGKERSWIAQSGEGIEKRPVVHIKGLDTVKWGPWQVTLKTGEALLITKQNDRVVKAVIRRKDGKAVIVKGEIWHHYSNGRVSLSSLRPPMKD